MLLLSALLGLLESLMPLLDTVMDQLALVLCHTTLQGELLVVLDLMVAHLAVMLDLRVDLECPLQLIPLLLLCLNVHATHIICPQHGVDMVQAWAEAQAVAPHHQLGLCVLAHCWQGVSWSVVTLDLEHWPL